MRNLRKAVLVVVLALIPTLVASAAPGGRGGGFLRRTSAAAGPNCFWTCKDGRTGSAEVKNYPADCAALCAVACKGPCTEVGVAAE